MGGASGVRLELGVLVESRLEETSGPVPASETLVIGWSESGLGACSF